MNIYVFGNTYDISTPKKKKVLIQKCYIFEVKYSSVDKKDITIINFQLKI